MKGDPVPKAIDLACEPDFVLGPLKVHPSMREIANGQASEVLEPRVMQVLVALARRRDHVVARDTLVEMCWGGRAVSEDAINRAITKLRKLSETSGAFRIDTVARVGYRLRASDGKPAAVAGMTTSEPVLVVLPFDNLSDDREMQYFSDGVSEEILHTIARGRNLKVIGRTSSFRFRGDDKNPSTVARELNATHVLDGSIRRSGDRVRVSAQLVEVDSQATLWAERYDSSLSDILMVQDEIATSIAIALNSVISAHRPTGKINSQAYDLYLRAYRQNLNELSADAARQSLLLLEQAVAIAPEFAQAWAFIGALRAGSLSGNVTIADDPAQASASAATTRALSLDPACAQAHANLALLTDSYAGFETKIRETKAAVTLAPSDAYLNMLHGTAWACVGRNADALQHWQRMAELEPLSPVTVSFYAWGLHSAGRSEDALAAFRSAERKFPESEWPWLLGTLALAQTGHIQTAERQFNERVGHYPDVTEDDRTLYSSSFLLWRLSESERRMLFERLLDPRQRETLVIGICHGAANFGFLDLAYDRLFEAVETGRRIAMHGTSGLGVPRAFHSAGLFFKAGASLRNDSRFAKLCARLGLVDYWTSSDSWPDCANEVPYDFKAECATAAG